MYDKICQILSKDFEARNSDMVLIMEVWESEGLHLTPDQRWKFKNLSSPETIRRTRQKLNEEGKFLPSDKVRNHRRIKSQEVQQSIPNTKPENVDQLINNRLFEMPPKRRIV